MAETPPTLGYTELARAVGYYLGFGSDETRWTAEELNHIHDVIDAGYQRFLYPDRIDAGERQHRWSFLRPVEEIILYADLTPDPSRTVSGTDGGEGLTRVTANTPVFQPTAVGGFLDIQDVGRKTILAWIDRTKVDIERVPGFSGKTYALESESAFALPGHFAWLDGPITLPGRIGYEIEITSEPIVRSHIASAPSSIGIPTIGAIRPAVHDSRYGQRYSLIVYPKPSEDIAVQIRYAARPAPIRSGNPYPLGGFEHFETLRLSCLSVAEERFYPENNRYRIAYQQRLVTSIDLDSQAHGADFFGYNSDEDWCEDWGAPVLPWWLRGRLGGKYNGRYGNE